MKRTDTIHTIARRAHLATVLLAGVVALAGVAKAEGHSHKAKSGGLTITSPTEVGGTILQPGEYEVREANSADGRVVEFVHHFRNETASELVQADEEEVAVRVKFTGQALNEPPKQTQLQLASNTHDATGVEIRGNAVEYVFAPAQLAAGQ